MRLRLAAALAAAVLFASAPARADLLIQIDQAAEQMTVSADGELLYTWPVSTGHAGYNTANGAFSPFRMDRDHYSRELDNAPMPYSIFFTKQGHAIHGTYEVRHLGQPVSHGCVRLSVKNAVDPVGPGQAAQDGHRAHGRDPRRRASHVYYGPPRFFFGRERAYFPSRRHYGGFPFGW